MNSNTKIGMLSGLLAIFVLAFALRGWGDSAEQRLMQEDQDPRSLKPSPRMIADLPLSVSHGPSSPGRPTAGQSSQAETDPAQMASSRPGPPARQGHVEPRVAETMSPQTVTYTVRPGDSLALIAKRCYGVAQGNRRRVVKALFWANRDSLKTADKLRIGQTLLIPSLPQAASGSDLAHLTPQAPASRYTVRDGDSLWKIAATQLGEGGRYPDILRLNRDLIEHEDDLRPGTRLRLPGR